MPQPTISTVIDHGEIGTGSVVPFSRRRTRRLVRPHTASAHDRLCAFTACGESLAADGIRTGDVLICRSNFDLCEIRPRTVCIVRLYGCELTAKRLRFESDRVHLLDGAGDTWRTVDASDVEVMAIVIAFQREL